MQAKPSRETRMSAAPPMPGTEGNDWQTALWRELCAAPARACGPLIAQYSQKPVHLTSAGRRNPCMCTALQLSAAFQQPKGALSYAGVCMHWVTGTLYLLRGSSTCELRSCAAALPCACVTSLPQMGHACEREHHDPCVSPPASCQCLPDWVLPGWHADASHAPGARISGVEASASSAGPC